MVNCNLCNIEMVKCKFISQAMPGLEPYISIKSKIGLHREKRSEVSCYVCPACGHVELRAVNLDIFK